MSLKSPPQIFEINNTNVYPLLQKSNEEKEKGEEEETQLPNILISQQMQKYSN